MVVNHFKMRSSIIAYNLSGMGCSAGIISIGLAQELLQVPHTRCALSTALLLEPLCPTSAKGPCYAHAHRAPCGPGGQLEVSCVPVSTKSLPTHGRCNHFNHRLAVYHVGCGCVCQLFSLVKSVPSIIVAGQAPMCQSVCPAVQRYNAATVLVVSMENITQNWYFGNQRSMLIPNCLFRVGGAAVLLSNKGRDYWRARCVGAPYGPHSLEAAVAVIRQVATELTSSSHGQL